MGQQCQGYCTESKSNDRKAYQEKQKFMKKYYAKGEVWQRDQIETQPLRPPASKFVFAQSDSDLHPSQRSGGRRRASVDDLELGVTLPSSNKQRQSVELSADGQVIDILSPEATELASSNSLSFVYDENKDDTSSDDSVLSYESDSNPKSLGSDSFRMDKMNAILHLLVMGYARAEIDGSRNLKFICEVIVTYFDPESE